MRVYLSNAHSHNRLNLSEIKISSPIRELILKLSIPNCTDIQFTKESIMDEGKICLCDKGYMCEHRLQHIVNFINDKYDVYLDNLIND